MKTYANELQTATIKRNAHEKLDKILLYCTMTGLCLFYSLQVHIGKSDSVLTVTATKQDYIQMCRIFRNKQTYLVLRESVASSQHHVPKLHASLLPYHAPSYNSHSIIICTTKSTTLSVPLHTHTPHTPYWYFICYMCNLYDIVGLLQ